LKPLERLRQGAKPAPAQKGLFAGGLLGKGAQKSGADTQGSISVVGLLPMGGSTFDAQCALLSLPIYFGTELHTIPNAVPYLKAEPERIERWKTRIGENGFKIGIAWQGRPDAKVDRGRSIPLSEFAPIARVNSVRLISLQKNDGLDQLERLPTGMSVETLS